MKLIELRKCGAFSPLRLPRLVPVSGRRSPFGREMERVQFKSLVVQVEYEDGERSTMVSEIPDGRTTQTVTVEFPRFRQP
jgi:hypothetical protein